MTEIITTPNKTRLPATGATIAAAGEAANAAADRTTFTRYQSRRPASTLAAQRADLARFAAYLAAVGLTVDAAALFDSPLAWDGMTHGLVEGFVQWQLQQGFAVASINRALSTVKLYVKLCGDTIDQPEQAMIRAVTGINHKDQRHVDERRDTTRVGRKKEKAVAISHEQAAQLKQHPDTPQGRRDALLMCLLLDHGLRESEVYDLQVGHLDVKKGTMTFFRRKVNINQTHKLSADTLRAATAYLQHDAPALGHLLRGSRRGKQLTGTMSISAIKRRVRVLGAAVGIDSLSPHDCRHYWATTAAEKGVNPLWLQEAGGWASLDMPRRYVARSAIANEGMV
jgi:integrase